jgi:hypothetical protein
MKTMLSVFVVLAGFSCDEIDTKKFPEGVAVAPADGPWKSVGEIDSVRNTRPTFEEALWSQLSVEHRPPPMPRPT